MTTWLCPPGVTHVLVEGWGQGGAGISSIFPSQTGQGAGGGAYGRTAGVPVIPGNTYLVKWTGPQTLFGDGSHLNVAAGGNGTIQSSGPGHGGNGGDVASTVADTKFGGGGGAWFGPSFPTNKPGGGGGSCAGRTGAGVDGNLQTGGAGPDGSTGGNGGDAGDPPGVGQPGTGVGAGGGAAGSSAVTSVAGGAGTDGALLIYDDTSGDGWLGVLAGTSPVVGSFGAPPAPPPPPYDPKTRKTTVLM